MGRDNGTKWPQTPLPKTRRRPPLEYRFLCENYFENVVWWISLKLFTWTISLNRALALFIKLHKSPSGLLPYVNHLPICGSSYNEQLMFFWKPAFSYQNKSFSNKTLSHSMQEKQLLGKAMNLNKMIFWKIVISKRNLKHKRIMNYHCVNVHIIVWMCTFFVKLFWCFYAQLWDFSVYIHFPQQEISYASIKQISNILSTSTIHVS